MNGFSSNFQHKWDVRQAIIWNIFLIIPPATKLGGVYWIHPVCLSVCLSVTLSCPPCSIYSSGWILSMKNPCLVQMINSMRGCVACDDLWPWPISSRSFGLDLENRVRSVASTVPDGLFPYLAQMITSMRRCVACDDLWPWPISSRSFDLDLENRVRSVASTVLDGVFLYLTKMITIIWGCVACYVFFKICKFEFLAIFWNFSALTLKKNLQFSMDSFHI